MQDSFARLNEGHVYKTIAHTVCNDKSTGVGRSLSAWYIMTLAFQNDLLHDPRPAHGAVDQWLGALQAAADVAARQKHNISL